MSTPAEREAELERMARVGGFKPTQPPPPPFSETVDVPLWPWGAPADFPLTLEMAAAVFLAAGGEPIAVSREFAAERVPSGELSSEVIGWAVLTLGDDGIRARVTFHASPGAYRFAVPAVQLRPRDPVTGEGIVSARITSIGLTNTALPGFKPMRAELEPAVRDGGGLSLFQIMELQERVCVSITTLRSPVEIAYAWGHEDARLLACKDLEQVYSHLSGLPGWTVELDLTQPGRIFLTPPKRLTKHGLIVNAAPLADPTRVGGW